MAEIIRHYTQDWLGTYCGRAAWDHMKFTMDRTKVTCLVCLKAINARSK